MLHEGWITLAILLIIGVLLLAVPFICYALEVYEKWCDRVIDEWKHK